MTSQSKPINLGILIGLGGPFAALDAIGPADMFGSVSSMTSGALQGTKDAHLIPSLLDINYHWIGSSTLAPVTATGGLQIQPTCTIATCPPLTYLLIPGGSPTLLLSDEINTFIREKCAECDAVFGVCTGSLLLARTGVLDNKRAVSTKMMLKLLVDLPEGEMKERVRLPRGVLWQRDLRWVRDGKFWTTSGGAPGLEMIEGFLRTILDKRIVDGGLMLTETRPAARPEDDPYAFILEGVDLQV